MIKFSTLIKTLSIYTIPTLFIMKMKTSLITHSQVGCFAADLFILLKKKTRSKYKKEEKKNVWEKNKKKNIFVNSFLFAYLLISSDYTKSALVHFQTIDRTFHYYSLVSEVLIADFSLVCNTHCKQIRENHLWEVLVL